MSLVPSLNKMMILLATLLLFVTQVGGELPHPLQAHSLSKVCSTYRYGCTATNCRTNSEISLASQTVVLVRLL